jgi:phospholipase/carboxylesterase
MGGHVHVSVPGEGPLTLLLLHGTGGSEHDLIDLGRVLLPGAPLLSPRGKVMEGNLRRWFRRVGLGVFDVEDLRERAADLAAFVKEKAPGRVVAVGYSNGANIAGGLLLGHPEVLAGAVLLRPMVPYVPEVLPDLSGKPVWIGTGTDDPYSPPEEVARLESLLREAGASVTVNRAPGGHGLTEEDVAAAARWVSSVL